MTSFRHSLAASCAVAAVLAACGGGSSEEPSTTANSFVAVSESFRGYHSWTSFDVSAEASALGIHDGSVIEYVNTLPPTGSTEFPLATIIVKEATGGTVPHELFAMVRRGGNFNATGARGWEWFELENLTDGNDGVKIVWRGFGPPIGEEYGGDAEGGCNGCHTACADAVCSTPLQLANFQ
ncbi:MAG: hypothetical protein ACOY0T_19150 [Myxococcota bacterium]